jgi:hypothetical protein
MSCHARAVECLSDALVSFRRVAPADQPCTRDGVMAGATRVSRDQRRAVAGEAGDAVDAGGVEGVGEGFDPAECPLRRRTRMIFPRREAQEEGEGQNASISVCLTLQASTASRCVFGAR